MRAKLTLIVVVTIAVAMLVGGATMALFTDTAANAGNVFTAGRVDIAADRDMGDPIPGPMFYTTHAEGQFVGPPPGALPLHPTGPWFPGRTVIRTLDVRNMGSLAVRLHQVSATITSINGQAPGDVPALAASFASNMNVKIYMAGHPTQVLYNGPLSLLVSGPQACIIQPVISARAYPGWPPMVQIAYAVTMSRAAGNDLQGIVPVVTFSVFAVQTANNP